MDPISPVTTLIDKAEELLGHSPHPAIVALPLSMAIAMASGVSPDRGLYAAMKCLCFCYLGLELALTHGPVALIGELTADAHTMIRMGAQGLTWITAAFCLVRGLPVLVEGWKYFAGTVRPVRGAKSPAQEAA